MKSTAALTAPLRSEAFAEDLFEPDPLPAPPEPATVRWTAALLPLGVALAGVAFAVLPPLA